MEPNQNSPFNPNQTPPPQPTPPQAPAPPVEPPLVPPVPAAPQPPVQNTAPTGPNPATPTLNPTPPSPTATPVPPKRKRWLLPLLALLILVLIGLGVFLLIKLTSKPEVKVGNDFIIAVQKKDYATVDRLIEPELRRIAQKAENNDVEKKDVFYKGFLDSSGFSSTVGKSKPEHVSTSISKGGGTKHAILVYKVDSTKVSVIEIYEKDEPRVLYVVKGDKKVSDNEFKESYEQYKALLDFLDQSLDSPEATQNLSGSN